ncbi:MAG: hypothetical protein A3G95_06105 [Flavobacteria bacterium RIFCSPLOWO2_12_FULL_31_7]|nr:MAG: hypothetical protein A3G95_06105 [Flavobacteria bacterium RIFCSPLOWO2_12_FULL_31_7]
MKKNIQNLLKRDLEVVPLIAYFVFYFLYLLFDRVLEMKDYAVLVKPIIIPLIAFLYITNKNSKKSFLSLLLLIFIFISDNSLLLEIRSFHIYATIIYFFCLMIFLYYSLSDVKYFKDNSRNKSKLAYILIGIVFFSLVFLLLNYDFKSKSAEKFVAFEYMITFLVVFVVSIVNYVRYKTKKAKYFFLTILCLFLSDLCFSIHHYYNGHVAFKFLIFIVEVPVYYFLLKYLLKRDKDIIEQ